MHIRSSVDFTTMLAKLVLKRVVGIALASPFTGKTDTLNLFQRSTLISSGCSTTGPTSCHNTYSVSNPVCCFGAPGVGTISTALYFGFDSFDRVFYCKHRHAKFWVTNPSTGPTDSWTIHGNELMIGNLVGH